MTYKEFFNQLEAKELAPVYFFYGEEEYIKRRAWEKLRAALLPEGLEQLNETVLEGASAAQIIDAVETLPLMCDKRLVLVRDWAPLLAGKSRNEADETERMSAYIARSPESCCLVFSVRGAPDGRKKMTQMLQKKAAPVQFAYLSDADLEVWVRAQLKPLGKRMEPQALAQLSFMAGRALVRLELELGKLAAYVGDRPQITKEDVEQVVPPSLECTVFQMIDRLLERNALEAHRLLKGMLESGETRIGILAMLTRQMRMMLHIKLLRERGVPLVEAEKQLELSHFVASRAAQQAARFQTQSLEAGYRACVEADYGIKSGQMRDVAALDRLMLLLGQLT